MLWEHYDGELWLYLNNPVTEGQICSKTKMGNVVLTKDMVAMMLVTMVQQTCKKGQGAFSFLYLIFKSILLKHHSDTLQPPSQLLAYIIEEKL